ncbi:hypothetical protein [Acidovorax sp. SUPP2539]|uniref:hypothetical protein n=1 Tax=Acidovorax sp. SUPP2539 TaxID=2920878 RepID=UPI0023DE5362|nr:hypothetical protein [Acidovorax sp. SUPP2539]GKS91206.1 hypothetical protein AVTE2539_17595 [Acidovorax sp. SUPP2539]
MNITLDQIYSRCEEVGDCWIWQGATSDTGYPIMKRHGGPCLLVRRVVMQLTNRPPAARQPVTAACEDKRCCSPKHLRLSTPSKVGKRAAANGAFSSPARGAKIAAARRAASGVKLTLDQAQEIRLSTESGPVLAERYKIHRSQVNSIKRGEAWKDYSNPFARLGARP